MPIWFALLCNLLPQLYPSQLKPNSTQKIPNSEHPQPSHHPTKPKPKPNKITRNQTQQITNPEHPQPSHHPTKPKPILNPVNRNQTQPNKYQIQKTHNLAITQANLNPNPNPWVVHRTLPQRNLIHQPSGIPRKCTLVLK